MAFYNVKNANGDFYNPTVPYPYESWIDYWEKKKGWNYKATVCRCCGKIFLGDKDLVGGHVVIPGFKNVYITPLCMECNNPKNTKSFSVEDTDLILIP